MNTTLRNIIAVIAGWLGGSIINMGLIETGHVVFPIEGVNPKDMDALAAVMPTLSAEHFIFPLLAHALGTFAGAIIAGLIAATYKMRISLSIGVLFLIGGIAVNYLLPGPSWFAITDILLAYIPMAYLGGKIALKKAKR